MTRTSARRGHAAAALGRTSKKWPYAGASADPARVPRRGRARRRPARRGRPGRRPRAAARPLRRGRAERRPRRRSRCYGEERHAEMYGVDRARRRIRARARARRDRTRDADARDLSRLAGAERRARRHAAPAHPRAPGVERHGRPGEAGGAWLHDIDVTPGSLLAAVLDTTRVDGLVPPPPSGRQGRRPACASPPARTTASSKGSSSTARGSSPCSGIPRTPPTAIPRSRASSTRSVERAVRLTARSRRCRGPS